MLSSPILSTHQRYTTTPLVIAARHQQIRANALLQQQQNKQTKKKCSCSFAHKPSVYSLGIYIGIDSFFFYCISSNKSITTGYILWSFVIQLMWYTEGISMQANINVLCVRKVTSIHIMWSESFFLFRAFLVYRFYATLGFIYFLFFYSLCLSHYTHIRSGDT